MSNTGKSYGKKIVFAVITLALLCYLALAASAVGSVSEFVENAEAAWDNTVAKSFASGDGSLSDPYVIKTAQQLAYFRNQVNAGNNYSGEYIVLGANIDLISASGTKQGFGTISEVKEHSSSSFSGTTFQGTFDGRYYEIKNLYWNGANYRGLFGHIGANGKVLNLTVSSVELIASGILNGTIAVVNEGTIDNCVVASGSIKSAGTAGGIAAYVGGGTITRCINYADVLPNGNVAVTSELPGQNDTRWLGRESGGVAGVVVKNSTIDQCAFYGVIRSASALGTAGGDRTGGIVGALDNSTLTNSYFIGEMYNTLDSTAQGGLTGEFYSPVTVRNSYYQVTGGAVASALGWQQNQNESATQSGIYTSGSAASGALTSGVWTLASSKHGGYPYLKDTRLFDSYNISAADMGVTPGEVTSGYSNTSGTQLTTSNFLSSFRQAGDVGKDEKFYLSSDLTVTMNYAMSPHTCNFSGVLDGNGHTLTLNLDSSWREIVSGSNPYNGILCSALSGGTIKNLNIVVNASTLQTANNDCGGNAAVGLVAGNSTGGTIDNCNITINNLCLWGLSSNNGELALGGIFGFVGKNASGGTTTISNTEVNVNGNFKLQRQNSGGWSWISPMVGGLYGSHTLNITDSKVNVASGAAVTYLTSGDVGSVSGGSGHYGGFVGETMSNCTLNISNSFYDFDGSYSSSKGGGTNGKIIGANQASVTASLQNIYYDTGTSEASVVYNDNGGSLDTTGCKKVSAFDNGSVALSGLFIDPKTPGMLYMQYTVDSDISYVRFGNFSDMDGVILSGGVSGMHIVRLSSALLQNATSGWQKNGGTLKDPWTDQTNEVSGLASGIIPAMQGINLNAGTQIGTWQGGTSISGFSSIPVQIYNSSGTLVWDSADGGDKAVSSVNGHLLPGDYYARFAYSPVYGGFFGSSGYAYNEYKKFSITKRDVAVSVADRSSVYGDLNVSSLSATANGVYTGGTQDSFNYTVTNGVTELRLNITISVNFGAARPTVGDYTITVNVAEVNSGFYDLTVTNGTYAITERPVTVEIDNKEKIYGENDPQFTYSASGVLDGDTLNIVIYRDDPDANRNVGDYAIKGTDNDNNYSVTFTQGTLSILQRPVNVIINDHSKFYGEANPAFEWSYAEEQPSPVGGMAYRENAEDVITVLTECMATTGSVVENYDITGTATSDNYSVTVEKGTLTVNPRPILITPDAEYGHVYGESGTTILTYSVSFNDASLTGNAIVTGDTLNGALARAEGANAGRYAINLGTLTSKNNANYNITLASATVYYVISPRPLKYSVTLSGMQSNEDGYFIYYGDFKNSMVTISPVTGDGYYAVVAGETVTVSAKFKKDGNDIAEVKDVGAYSVIGITAVFDAASGAKESNYTVTFTEEAAFSVLPGQVTVNIDNKTKTYGDAAPAFTFTLSEGSELAYGEEEDVLGVTLELKDGDDGVNFGEYTITGNWNNPNYAVTFVDGKLTVNKRAITVTLKQNFSSVYGEPIVAPDISAITLTNGTLAGSLPVHNNLTEAGFSVTFNDNIEDAATYSGYISAKCENVNYEVTWTEGRYTADYIVTPRPVKYVITVQNMHEGNYLYYGEFVESTHVTVSGPVTEEEGFYPVVAPESITVKPSYSYTAPGGETQPFADIIDAVKNVGTYTVSGAITYGTDTLESNYSVTVTVTPSQSFRIDKRHVTITIGNYTKVYGDKDPVFDWSISDGETVYGEDAHEVIAYSLSRDQGENKGTYEIRAVMISSVNYDVAVVEGKLTVEPKPVTVTITSATKTYGEADPDFKWTHTELANYEGASVLGFTVTREKGEDVKEGGYALSGKATNANYSVTVEEGSVLTIDKLAVSFAVTNAQLPYNTYTVDTLPEPAGLGADAKVSGTLPYGDKANVVFDYKIDAATIVSLIAGDYLYIDTTVSFVKEDGSDANGNYTYSPITVILKVVSSGLNVDLSGYDSEYDFDPASGIILSLDEVSVKTQSGNIISAQLEAKITSSDGSTEYFTPDEKGNIVISYVPSVSKSDKYVSLKFIVTASASGYDDSTGEKIFTLNKANYDLKGIAFEDLTETYNGEAHEIAYTGTLPAGLTASVSYAGDNVNYSGTDVTATLTFDLTGQEAGGTVYYSYNLPESRTAKLTIKRASVVITVYPQIAVYDKTVPVPSAEEGKDYIITKGEIFGSDDLGITLAITDADYAVGVYDLILSINNTNYILSANSSTFSIEKRVVYVKLTDEYFLKTYGDADPDWNNAVSAVTVYPSGAETGMGLAGDDAVTAINIESVSRVAGENAAAYTVTVNCGESNYDVRSDLLSKFIIAPREITLILDKSAFKSVYGEEMVMPSADVHLSLKAGSALVGAEAGKNLSEAGFTVSFTGEFAAGGIAGYYGAGTYKDVVEAEASNGNYSAIFEGGSVADYTVTKRPVWITVTPVTVEYGDSGELKFKLSEIQPEKGGLARDEAADDIGITLTREGGDRPDVRKYNIDCIVKENSNYEVSVMNSPEAVYEVTAREIKIIINDAEKTYGDETPVVFTWKMADGYKMAYKEDVSVLGVALALEEGNGVNAGTYTISGTSSAGTNYLVVFENATFTVHKKQAVIDVGGVKVEYVYTGEPFRITEGATHNNTDVESATSQLKYPDKEFLNVSDSNKYKITIGETDNFLAAEATITVTIKKATVVFDWSGVNGEYVYNGREQTVTGVTINISDGTEIIYSNNTFTDVPAEGVLEVTVTVAENDNILEASETRKVTVSRATIDMSGVSFDSAEYIFDATEKALTVSGTLPWGIEGVSYAGNALTEVGTTEAVASFVYNDGNFNVVEDMTATLTIIPRTVAVVLESGSKEFGSADPVFGYALAAEQPYEGTDTVISLRPLDISIVRNEGENVGEYKLTATGNDACYILEIAEEGVFTIVPREIVFAVSGTFASEYDGKAKEVNVNEALTVASGSLAPVHADIASSGAVSVSVAEGVSIIDADVYENAIVFSIIGGNYAATFEGTTENVVTASYTVTRRELTVKLLDQRLLKEESIDQNAYEITAGALVKGDTLGITILKGNELGVDRYELISEYANLNYDITFETGTLVYAVRAIITAVTPADFLYTGEPFAIDVTINSTAPLVFYINGEYSANSFVEPGHYVVTISAAADDTYREPLNVTVIFNILAPEIKHEADGAEISVSTETGFYPEDSFDIIREQGRENSTIAEMISGEYTIVDGYVLNVSTEGGTVSLGDYLKNNYAGEEHVVRIKVPEQYASDETVECVIIRGGEASMETLDVKDGYIEITAADVEAVAFIAERETLMAVIIIAAVMSALLLAAIGYFIFRNKAY